LLKFHLNKKLTMRLIKFSISIFLKRKRALEKALLLDLWKTGLSG